MNNFTFLQTRTRLVFLLCLSPVLFAQGQVSSPPPTRASADGRRLWKPVPDDVYLQEIGRRLPRTHRSHRSRSTGNRPMRWWEGDG